jgi:hypothetical protein
MTTASPPRFGSLYGPRTVTTRSITKPDRGDHFPKADRVANAKPDWLIVAIPTVISLKTLHSAAGESNRLAVMAIFAALLGGLVATAFVRPVASRFDTRVGPLILLLMGAGIVLTRPSGMHNVAIFLALGALAFQISRTVNARRIIVSLIDGIGLYLLANVVCHLAGMRSPSESWRLALDNSRVIFPLTVSVNLIPVIAAAYIASVYLVIRDPGWPYRLFRVINLAAAVFVLGASDTRVAIGTAVLLLAILFIKPTALRWTAPVAVAFASFSPLFLRPLISRLEVYLGWLLSVVSQRSDNWSSIAELNGRGLIWERSMTYWQESVNRFGEIVVGYGAQGHYRSGASRTYSTLMARIVPDHDRTVMMHNSFLQQLYDGGIVGWLFLTLALLWASIRLSEQYEYLGRYALAGAVLMSALVIGSMTEVLLTADANVQTFWIMLLLVAATCQRHSAASEPQFSELLAERQGNRHDR